MFNPSTPVLIVAVDGSFPISKNSWLKSQKISQKNIPFIALTETWLKPYITDAMVDIEGYNVFRSDRSTRTGGGVLLYCHERIPITNVQRYDDRTCQALLCTYEISNSILCVVYRPPGCPEQNFKSCTSFISDYCDSVSDDFELNILGDFNFPRVNWSSHTVLPGGSESEQRSTKLLFDFMSDYLCDQVITEPTRLDKTLDLYLTNSEELITHVSCSSTPLSDHVTGHITHVTLVLQLLQIFQCQHSIA